MVKSLKNYFLFLLFCYASCFATETMPWFGDVGEFELRSQYSFQHYDGVKTESDTIYKSVQDHFFDASLSISPLPRFNSELECSLVYFDNRGLELDSLSLTGRYLFLNDIIGDFCSLSSGMSVIVPLTSDKMFLSSHHHSHLDLKFHCSVGKEFSKGRWWVYRFWCVGAIGLPSKGSPWAEVEVFAARNFKDKHEFRLFSKFSRGFGAKNITSINDFAGYSHIRYRFIDVGCRYTFTISWLGSFHVEALRTFDSKNYPYKQYLLSIGSLIPFSL